MLVNKWKLYRHTTPVIKYYYGITNADNPNKRWLNGLGYRTQTVFFRAIIKYGWDNIKHEIIAENLTLEEAKKLEKEYIKKDKTNVREYGHSANGYNMTEGGDSTPFHYEIENEEKKNIMEEKVYSKIRIPVDAYDMNGKFIKSFESIRAASKELHCDPGSISNNIKGKLHYTKGYRFSIHEEPIKNGSNKYYEKQVNMFDFAGNYLQTFKSCAEASKYVNFGVKKDSSIIAACAKGDRGSYKGYLWSYTDKPFMNQKKKKARETPINMYNLNGEFIKRFNSMSDARNEIRPGIKSLSALRKACIGECKSAYGYKWEYAN